ncbi:MAG TPA: histidine phosphatase family protein [Hyphomicrobium sp.]|nr:histidine phosphatase family protein [Hyphomicrobium sp.]
MLTLTLLRHAKSSWTDPSLDDHDRPLAKRGVKAVPLVAEYMRQQNITPDIVLCSDAMRTRATLALLLAELGTPNPRIVYDETLYLAAPQTIMSAVAECGKKHVLIVGHNPGMHALALELVGDGNRKLLSTLAREFPTAALAVLTFDVASWNDVKPLSGQLTHFTTPRKLAD